MESEFPVFSQLQDAPDDERVTALTVQASLPSEFVDPTDAVGDDAWAQAMQDDLADGGTEAYAEFRTRWDWGMTPQERADALSRAVMDREMRNFIGESAQARPSVDPEEYADEVRATRLERARR